MRKLVPLLLLSLVQACSGGSDGGGGGVIVAPTPTPAPATPTPSPTTTPTPPAGPVTGSDFFTSIATLYTTQPDLTACNAGQLKPEVPARALAVLNDIRAHHNLPPVQYAGADEAGAMQSALMQAANGQLNHMPPTSWNCYTTLGATVSGQSNLFGGSGAGLTYISNDDIMIGWLTDVNNLVANNVGHRRWLLYPFLGTVAYGRVAGRYQTSNRSDAAALKVINTAQATPASLPSIVAYPYQDYPAKYFTNGAILSFSAIADARTAFGANATVDYSQATVTVQQRGGAALAVSNIAYDNQGYGLPNNLQFNVAGLQNNVIYDVTIDRVRANGSLTTYMYWFRIVP
ncbi:MAG: CAP domain-containing protein [Sphingomonas sp.]